MTQQEFLQGQAFKCAGAVYRFEPDRVIGDRQGIITRFFPEWGRWVYNADVVRYDHRCFKVLTVFIGNVITRYILFENCRLADAKDLAVEA